MKIRITFALNKHQLARIQSLLGDEATTPREDAGNWLEAHIAGELENLGHDLKLAKVGEMLAKEKEHDPHTAHTDPASQRGLHGGHNREVDTPSP